MRTLNMSNITNEWQKIKLGDISEVITNKINVSYISTENMLPNKGGIYEATNLPNILLTPSFQINDILVSNIRPYFKKIWYAKFSGGCSNDVLIFRAKQNTDPKFLYYVLSDDRFFRYAMSTSKGTKMPRGDKIAIMKYQVPKFDMVVQKKIAAVLSALDDKIELNNKINQNLEQQAQAIFKSWFVDFKPFGGKMPDDWKIKKLSECTNQIIRGFTSKYVEKSNLINLNQKVNKGNILEKQYYKYLDERFEVPKEKFARKKDILLNSLGQGTLGRIHFWNENAKNIVIDQHIAIVRAKKEVTTAEYLYLLLSSSKYKEYFENCITGTTGMLMLNISVVRDTEITLPTFSIQTQFSNIASSFYEMIEQNNQETARLAQLRDTLLPKLMSGEIDFTKIELKGCYK